MAQQTINIGTTANDGTGDPLRIAFDKVNSNFTELYNDESQGEVNSIIAGDGISVDTATGNVTITNTITNNNQLTNGAGYVDGSGTANYVPKWTDGDTIGNSVIYDDGTNVGIGTATPNANLHIISTNPIIKLQSSGANTTTQIDMLARDVSNVAYLVNIKATDTSLTLASGGNPSNSYVPTERMRITSGGDISFRDTSANEAFYWDASTARLGLGTTSPSYSLDIRGAVNIQNTITSQLFLQSNSGAYFASINVGGTGNGLGYTTGQLYFENSNNSITFNTKTGAGESMRIDSSGTVSFAAAASLSSASASIGHLSSNGYMYIKGGTGGLIIGDDSTDSRIQIEDNSNIRFETAGSERMRIDSAGNVGINESNPDSNNAGVDRVLQITSTRPAIRLKSSYSPSGADCEIVSEADGAMVLRNHYESGVISFLTNDAERMRIDNAGAVKQVGVGSGFTAATTQTAGTIYGLFVGAYGATEGSIGSGTVSYVVYSNGNVVNTNNSYGAISDAKLKENVTDASPKLDDLMQVKVRNYNLIGEETKQLGVVAQELEELFPSMVSESPDIEEQEVTDAEGNVTTERVDLGTTTKSVKYSVFVPMLIKAMQEQQEIINDLKSRIETLENN